MATLDQKIEKFITDYFPDIDYSILGNNANKPEHKMGLNYEYFVNSMEYYSLQKNIDNESIKQLSMGDLRGIDACFFVLNKRFFYVSDMVEMVDIIEITEITYIIEITRITGIMEISERDRCWK